MELKKLACLGSDYKMEEIEKKFREKKFILFDHDEKKMKVTFDKAVGIMEKEYLKEYIDGKIVKEMKSFIIPPSEKDYVKFKGFNEKYERVYVEIAKSLGYSKAFLYQTEVDGLHLLVFERGQHYIIIAPNTNDDPDDFVIISDKNKGVFTI